MSESNRGNSTLKNSVYIVLTFLVVFSAFYVEYIRRGMSPTGGLDVYSLYIPSMILNGKSLLLKTFPLWNPYNYFGVPHYANVQSGVFIPVSYFAAFLSPPNAYIASVMTLQCFAALWFYLLLTDVLRLKPLIAMPTTLMFAFSGYLVNKMTLHNLYIAIPWIVGSFYFLAALSRSYKKRYVCGVVFCTALMFSAGPPMLVYGIYLCGIEIIFLSFCFPVILVSLKSIKKAIALGATFSLGAALAAPQLLAVSELTRFSRRANGLSFDEFGYAPLPLALLPATLFPDVGPSLYGENVGSLPLIVLFSTFVLTPLFFLSMERIHRKWILFSFSISVIGLVLAIGPEVESTARFAYNYLPLLKFLRMQSRWLIFCIIAGCIVSGISLGYLLLSTRKQVVFSKFSVAASFLGLWFAGSILSLGGLNQNVLSYSFFVIGGYLFLSLLCLLTSVSKLKYGCFAGIISLLLFEVYTVRYSGAVGDYARPFHNGSFSPVKMKDLLSEVHSDDTLPRMIVADNKYFNDEVRGSISSYFQSDEKISHEIALPYTTFFPGTNLYYDISMPTGVFGDLAELDGYKKAFTLRSPEELFLEKTYNFLKVFHIRYIVISTRWFNELVLRADKDGTHWTKWYSVKDLDSTLTLLRTKGTLGRAFWIQHLPADPSKAWTQELLKKFADTSRTARLEVTIPNPNELLVSGRRNNKIKPGYIVINQTYYPGWNASNGEEIISGFNGALSILPVTNEVERVEFSFFPRPFKFGIIVSLLVLLFLCLLFWQRTLSAVYTGWLGCEV